MHERDPQTITVHDQTYYVTPLPAGEGIDLGVTLMKVIGGPLGALFGMISGKGLDTEIDGKAVSKAIGGIPTAILANGGSALAMRVLRGTKRVDKATGMPVDVSAQAIFDTVYARNYGELAAILWAVIDLNYGPFSGATLRGWIERLLQYAESAGLLERLNTTAEPMLSLVTPPESMSGSEKPKAPRSGAAGRGG